MRHIERTEIPDILLKKHDIWQAAFDAKRASNPSARPDSSKYRHPSISAALENASFFKCFYCESKLSSDNEEVDHFVEVAIAPEKAYDWDNLYLACSNCNNKLDHNRIPVTDVLDSCKDSDDEIKKCITFEGECIRSCAASQKGLDTIRKYRLNTEVLDLKRSRWLLNGIEKTRSEIEKKKRKEGRLEETEEERKELLRFMQPDQPYSLMCEIYLKERYSYLFK